MQSRWRPTSSPTPLTRKPRRTVGTKTWRPAPSFCSDGETTVGRPTAAGADVAAETGVPVFTIAFGTADGFITDPVSGEIFPVPVAPEELKVVAEVTGGQAFEAQSGNELADAYDDVRDSLGETLGEEIEITKELTWRWALGAFLLLTVAWSLSLWWLRGMV